MGEIDYSMEYHHVNCDEYFWPDSEARIFPCILFLANTRDEKLYQENVSILSQMYKSLGCSCLQFDYILPAWMGILPAFESSFNDCENLGNQLIKIIKDNELDLNPLIVHVIGSDGAIIYSKVSTIIKDYINGAILESLPNNEEGRSSTSSRINQLQLQVDSNLDSWSRFEPAQGRVRSYLTYWLSSTYIIAHSIYQMFVYRDLESRLKSMEPDWRELIICEPSNVALARTVLHGRKPSLVPKKLLKFPPKRVRRNSLYQQNPRQYEAKVSLFLRNVCDDFVARTAAIELGTNPDAPLELRPEDEPANGGITLPSESVIVSPGNPPDPNDLHSESVIAPLETQSLRSEFVTSENQFESSLPD